MQLNGLRVRGTGADALDVADRYGAGSVLVAIPSITGEQLRAFAAPLLDAGLRVLVLPPVAELLGHVRPSDIRPITVADLLGRHPAEVDTGGDRRLRHRPAGARHGRRRLDRLRAVPPAAPLPPQRLVMLDRDESGLHGTQLELEGRALLDSPSLVLADIRDRERIFQVFQQHRPEVVFHAAALKHLPLLEFNPAEAWKTNVVGTHHVLEAAEATGVARLVNVSTDKAADPASVLGYVKRICERLTAEVADRTGLPYVSVRFGNVLGSKGSMLGVFERQIRDGGPITVTHPDVTRYFMTVRGGRRADHPGRRDRSARRGARARHGRAGAHRRGRHPPGRAVRRRRSRSSTPGCGRARSCTRCCSAPARSTCGPPTRSSARCRCRRCASTTRGPPARSTAGWCCRRRRWRSPPSGGWTRAAHRPSSTMMVVDDGDDG